MAATPAAFIFSTSELPPSGVDCASPRTGSILAPPSALMPPPALISAGALMTPVAAAAAPRALPRSSRRRVTNKGRGDIWLLRVSPTDRTAFPVVRAQHSRPSDHRPDPGQCGLVLDAVKAWPGSACARRARGATASLDGVST